MHINGSHAARVNEPTLLLSARLLLLFRLFQLSAGEQYVPRWGHQANLSSSWHLISQNEKSGLQIERVLSLFILGSWCLREQLKDSIQHVWSALRPMIGQLGWATWFGTIIGSEVTTVVCSCFFFQVLENRGRVPSWNRWSKFIWAMTYPRLCSSSCLTWKTSGFSICVKDTTNQPQSIRAI